MSIRNYVRKFVVISDDVSVSSSLALADMKMSRCYDNGTATEASDTGVMKSSFDELVLSYGLSKRTVDNMTQNIVIEIVVGLFSPWASFFWLGV